MQARVTNHSTTNECVSVLCSPVASVLPRIMGNHGCALSAGDAATGSAAAAEMGGAGGGGACAALLSPSCRRRCAVLLCSLLVVAAIRVSPPSPCVCHLTTAYFASAVCPWPRIDMTVFLLIAAAQRRLADGAVAGTVGSCR